MPPLPGNPQSPNQSRQAWLVCGLLLVAVGLIYGQTLGHDFIQYDDQVYVRQNRHVAAGLTLEGLRWAFTNGPVGEWYPSAMLSHMLDCQLFGLNAGGHHLTNLLLHAAAAIVLFRVWWRMSGELWPSAFVAGVFAVHPQHVESVAWISERRDVLSGLCFMLTLAAYLGYLRHGRPLWRYVLVALALSVGLMAKPILVTVPALLLLLDFWPLARLGAAADKPAWTSGLERPGLARLVIEKIPLFALAAGEVLMTIRTHDHPTKVLAWSARLSNAAVACVTYAVQMFWPVDLALYYPLPADGWPDWQVATAVAILAVVSTAVVVWRRRCPYWFAGWFWYLGMLTPVLGLVQVAAHGMADRYMFLPSIGLSIAVTWGAVRLCAGRPAVGRLLAGLGGLTIVLLAGLACRQTWLWRSDESLWAHAVACTSDNGRAERYLADALAAEHRVGEATAFYLRAQQHPPDATPFINLGVLLRGEGRTDEATDQFRQAVATDPEDFRAQMNLGAMLALEGQLDEAMPHLQRAVELKPDDATARIELAHAWAMQKRFDEALVQLERAAVNDPFSSVARNDLGTTLFRLDRIDEAIVQFQAALALDPDSALAHVNLAGVLMAVGRNAEAMALYRRALELDSHSAAARRGLEKLTGSGAGATP